LADPRLTLTAKAAMDPFSTLKDASAGFAGFAAQISDGQWEGASCGDWPVSELVRHVIAGDAMAVALIDGATSEEAMGVLSGLPLEEDPVEQFNTTAATMLAAFQRPGVMEQLVSHPMGVMPAGQVLGFRIGEAALHGWDLARAIEVNDTLNAGVVQSVWDAMEPAKDILASLGIFGDGPSGSVGDDAPLQVRLLDLSGRRP
jgi:uncharacterized protein (TIGR03086 family)